jgi:hypothetical protein
VALQNFHIYFSFMAAKAAEGSAELAAENL